MNFFPCGFIAGPFSGQTGGGTHDWAGGQAAASSNWNQPKKDDNVWNGPNEWGQPGVMETGTWQQANSHSRVGSSSGWGDESSNPQSWGSRNPNQGQATAQGFDSGTSIWEDPNAPNRNQQGWNSASGGQPPQSNRPPTGPNNWSQPPPQANKPGGWGDPTTNKLEDGSTWWGAAPVS